MMRTGLTLVARGAAAAGHGRAGRAARQGRPAPAQGGAGDAREGRRARQLAKGPEWAKANLPPDKLEQIRRLIEVDEQLLFRCQGKPLVLLPSSVDADPVQSTDDPADGEKPADGAAAATKAAPAKDTKAPATPRPRP